MEEKRSGALHEGNKKSGGQARKTSAPRSRREKEQIWLEHLKKTMSPAQYEAYVEREKKRRLMTGIGIGAGAVFFLLLAGSIGGRVVHSLKKPASAGTGAAVVQRQGRSAFTLKPMRRLEAPDVCCCIRRLSVLIRMRRAIMIFRRFLNILRHITVHRIL